MSHSLFLLYFFVFFILYWECLLVGFLAFTWHLENNTKFVLFPPAFLKARKKTFELQEKLYLRRCTKIRVTKSMVYVLESDKDIVRKLTIGVTQEPLKYGPFSAFFLLIGLLILLKALSVEPITFFLILFFYSFSEA